MKNKNDITKVEKETGQICQSCYESFDYDCNGVPDADVTVYYGDGSTESLCASCYSRLSGLTQKRV